jgi:hypothetical protein
MLTHVRARNGTDSSPCRTCESDVPARPLKPPNERFNLRVTAGFDESSVKAGCQKGLTFRRSRRVDLP